MTVPVPAGVIHVITADTITELLAMNQLQSLLDNERFIYSASTDKVNHGSAKRRQAAAKSSNLWHSDSSNTCLSAYYYIFQ